MSDDAQQQSRWQAFWPVIAGSVIGGVFAILGSYFATTFQMSAQSQAQKAEEQRKVFARLMGQKIVWKQLNIAFADANSTVAYDEERWKRAGSPNTSVYLDEGKYWVHRSADLYLELAKSNQIMLKDTANVQALFPDTIELRELCNRIYTFHSIITPEPPHGGSLADLTKWKDETDRTAHVFADIEYGKTTDDLLAYLLRQLRH